MATPKQITQNTGYGVDRGAGVDNPFAGTSYADMWENNPYRYLYYDPSFWDNIGLSNKAKDANSEYQRLYDEYVAGIYEQQRQDTYNSESAQVERQRQAGLNPDLLGVENSQTGQMQPPNAGMNPALNGQSPAVPILSQFSSILSFALNAYQGITSTLLSKDTAEITNFRALTESARSFVTQSFAEAFMNGLTPELSVASGKDAFGRQFSRRMSKRAENAFEHLFRSGDYDLQIRALQNLNNKFDSEIGYDARTLFSEMKDKNGESAVKSFITDMVELSLEEYRISRKANISANTKQKMLDDFRAGAIDKMITQYRNSKGNDLMTGLLLAGMLEGTGLSVISNPKGMLNASSDHWNKKATKFIKDFWNNGFKN